MSVHGTNTGYVTHYRNGEKPCGPCVVAHKTYQAKYHAARHVAVTQLIKDHADEYQTLLAGALEERAS